jgi:hypothetical protein
VEVELDRAVFRVEVEDGADGDPERFRYTIESWEDYGYRVGTVEISS